MALLSDSGAPVCYVVGFCLVQIVACGAAVNTSL
jgi:hypothetical protein